MKKLFIIIFISVGFFLVSLTGKIGLLDLSVYAGCSDHWICGPPWVCGDCWFGRCCWETRCCGPCIDGITECQVVTEGGFGICDFSCGPSSCICGSWINGACGGGSCSPTQRRQTRDCNPDGCNNESRCVVDPTCDIAPIGWHDGDEGVSATCLMRGWACDPDSWSTKLNVHFWEGSNFVGGTTANISNEPEVTAACEGDAGHRFAFNIPQSSFIWDGNPHTITAYALGVDKSGVENHNNPPLSGTPKTMTCPIDTTPPTCTITGLTSVDINTDATYVATGSDLNLTEVEIKKSPTEDRSWTSVVDNCAGPTCTGTTQFSSEGTYYVTCNAYDGVNQCSGNPWCNNFDPEIDDGVDCIGWEDCTSSDLLTVTATMPGPWWQVIDADVISQNGDIISSIPLSCVMDDCNPLFGLDGLGGYPGVPIYGGSTADFGEGGISSTDWLANTQTLFSKTYDYNYFRKMVRSDVQEVIKEIEQDTVNGGFFASEGTPKRGYVWFHFDGNDFPSGSLTINSSVNLIADRKVVVLVENADLKIEGRINAVDGIGFAMFIVGKDDSEDRGNIIVDAGVFHPSEIEIEGVFLSEGQFRTGEGDEQLHVRGMVVAYDGVVLERDLLGDNADEPAEVFEYAPDFVLTFPRDLTFKRLNWKEVAP